MLQDLLRIDFTFARLNKRPVHSGSCQLMYQESFILHTRDSLNDENQIQLPLFFSQCCLFFFSRYGSSKSVHLNCAEELEHSGNIFTDHYWMKILLFLFQYIFTHAEHVLLEKSLWLVDLFCVTWAQRVIWSIWGNYQLLDPQNHFNHQISENSFGRSCRHE